MFRTYLQHSVVSGRVQSDTHLFHLQQDSDYIGRCTIPRTDIHEQQSLIMFSAGLFSTVMYQNSQEFLYLGGVSSGACPLQVFM